MVSNQSRVGEKRRCPRRYYYQYRLHLAPRTQGVKPWAGLAVHAGLAAWYAGAGIEAMLAAYDDKMAGFPVTDATLAEYEKAKILWRDRLVNYPKFYPTEPFEVVMVPEQEIEVDLGKHKLGVRVDLIVKRKSDGELMVVDHKSTSRTGSSYTSQFFVDLQGSAYIYAASKLLGQNIQFWMTNVIKSTKEGWYERYLASRTQQQLDSFVAQTSADLDDEEFSRTATPDAELFGEQHQKYMDQHYRQFTHQCVQFGTCAYLSLCHVGQAALPVFAQRPSDYIDDADGD